MEVIVPVTAGRSASELLDQSLATRQTVCASVLQVGVVRTSRRVNWEDTGCFGFGPRGSGNPENGYGACPNLIELDLLPAIPIHMKLPQNVVRCVARG
jgi:hypothetical protein